MCKFKCVNFVVASVMLILLIPAAHATGRVIEVAGVGRVSVVPDIAIFSLSIKEQAVNLSAMKARVDVKTRKLLELCKKLNIQASDISSTEVQIHPRYDFETQKFLGYTLSRDIVITLTKMSNYTNLLDGSIDAGITTIRKIELKTADRMNLKNKALGSAIDAATEKANIIVKKTGVTLGKILSVRESNGGFTGSAGLFRGLAMASVRGMDKGVLEPGKISVSADVIMEFEIK